MAERLSFIIKEHRDCNIKICPHEEPRWENRFVTPFGRETKENAILVFDFNNYNIDLTFKIYIDQIWNFNTSMNI